MTGIWAFSANSRRLGVRAGEDDPMTGQDNRLLGLVDELDGLPDLAVVTVQRGLVAGKVDLQVSVVLVERVVRKLYLLSLHVLRHVDDDGAGPSGVGDVEGLFDHLGDLQWVHDQRVVLGDGESDARGVGLLEGIGTDGGARHLSDDGDYRDGVHLGGRDAGYEVGRSRAGRGPADADPAGYAGVAVGGVGGSLLVTSQDVPELRVLGKRLVERQDCSAGKTEDLYDALTYQALAQQLRPIHSDSHDLLTSRLRTFLFSAHCSTTKKSRPSKGTGLSEPTYPAVPPSFPPSQ